MKNFENKFNLENKEQSVSTLKAHIYFDEEGERFGVIQKFILLKDESGVLYFITSPGDHLSIKKSFEKKMNKEYESMGGSFLDFSPPNEIELKYQSSMNLGPLKIRPSELQKLLIEFLGDKYNIILEE